MILEEQIQKKGLREALKKEAPELLVSLENLQREEHLLCETLRKITENEVVFGPDPSSRLARYLSEVGGHYSREDDRVTNYGAAWEGYVMQNKDGALRFVPLIEDIKREMQKFFEKST